MIRSRRGGDNEGKKWKSDAVDVDEREENTRKGKGRERFREGKTMPLSLCDAKKGRQWRGGWAGGRRQG